MTQDACSRGDTRSRMATNWKKLSTIILLAIFINTVYSLEYDDTPISNEPQQTVKSTENTTDYRLPDNVVPNKYFIHLTPFIIPDNFTFNGLVKIVAKVKKQTSTIVLHVDQLVIHNVSVFSVSEHSPSTRLVLKNTTQSEKYQFLNIHMKSPISANTNVTIKISYSGIINTGSYGFFRNSYKVGNETRWIIATQFEPTGARKVFPCFDEPALKAIFRMSVKVHKNYTAISNTVAKSGATDDVVVFEATPIMSTYTLALVVCDYKSLAKTENSLSYKVWANSQFTHQLPYSLSVMSKAVDFYQQRLAIPYHIPKLEMVAIPDFSSVAMENWGLLIYSEALMLHDPAVTPLGHKRSIRNLIAHEIAHQWFGNLVTPKWWDYLWLNEAFAAYFEYHAHENSLASWNLESQFVVNELHAAFSVDALTSTHPVQHMVYSPDSISGLFDWITYNKGASLVRMLEKIVGQKIFYAAIHRYLFNNEFSTGTSESLYAAFDKEISLMNYRLNATVAEIMSSWILKSGFPVIDVQFVGDTVTLKQRRFFAHPLKNSTDQSTWVIPINWASRSNPNFNDTRKIIWLRENITTLTIENATNDWVIFNVQQAGFYRVNYDEEMWKRIINVLKSEEYDIIHEVNRAALIDDIFNLARVGVVHYDLVLSATQYLVNETNYVPWKSAFSGFTYLKRRLSGYPKNYKSFKIYVMSLLEPNYQRLGFNEKPGENDFDALLREDVLTWLCYFEHQECVNKSLEAFNKIQENSGFSLSPNQQNLVYCTAVRHGSTEIWNDLWKKFEKSNYALEKVIILSGLACSQNAGNLKRLLVNVIIPEFGMRKQDIREMIMPIAQSSIVGLQTTLDYIYDHYAEMLDFVEDDSPLQSILSSISELLSTDQLIEKYINVLENNRKNMSSIFESLQSSLRNSIYELDRYKESHPTILKWLNTNYPIE